MSEDTIQAFEGVCRSRRSDNRGNLPKVTRQWQEMMRQAGLTDGELAEISAVVALNLYTSYFNHLVQTPLDFPPALNLPSHG